MSKTGVKLETIIHDGILLVFATTRVHILYAFPECNNAYTNDKTMLKHFRTVHA